MKIRKYVFAGILAGTTGPASAELTFDFLLIAEEGDTVVGAPGPLSTNYRDPAVDDQGRVAFQGGTLDSPTSTSRNDTAIIWDNGVLRQIAREDSIVPGTTVTDFGQDDHIEIRNGLVAFTGDATDSGTTDFIAISNGTTSRIPALEGTTSLPVPSGDPIITSIPDSEGFGFDGVRTAFTARYDGGNERGIFLEDGAGNISAVAVTGGVSPSGSFFDDLDDAMPDPNGPGVAFAAKTLNGSTEDEGIFVATDGTNSSLTTVSTLSDYSLTPEAEAFDFGEPDIDAGRVVFDTSESDFDVPFNSPEATPSATVQFWENGVLTTIADQSTVLPNGETAIQFTEVGIAGDYVAFGAQTDDSGSTLTGIFLYDLTDQTFYTVIELDQVIDGKTVTNIGSFNRPFLSDGYIALDLQFDSTDNAVYRAEIVPEPTSLALLGLGGLLVARRRR